MLSGYQYCATVRPSGSVMFVISVFAYSYLVVRLKGPHVDREPRVRIRGLDDVEYRRIWSERDGPPYEVWLAPNPLPDVLKFYRGDKEVEVRRYGSERGAAAEGLD